jgi:hypothetical protein
VRQAKPGGSCEVKGTHRVNCPFRHVANRAWGGAIRLTKSRRRTCEPQRKRIRQRVEFQGRPDLAVLLFTAGIDLGFQRDHVLLVDLNAAGSGYDRERLSRAYQELLARLEAIPGVRSATLCGYFPMSGMGAMRPATVEGYQAKPGERRFLSENWVAPQYFATFGIPLLMGRDFGFQDQGRPRVAIVNQTLVRYFFGDGNPIGRHIVFDGDSQPFEIVGVVGDAKSGDVQESAVTLCLLQQLPVRKQFLALRVADLGRTGSRGG